MRTIKSNDYDWILWDLLRLYELLMCSEIFITYLSGYVYFFKLKNAHFKNQTKFQQYFLIKTQRCNVNRTLAMSLRGAVLRTRRSRL